MIVRANQVCFTKSWKRIAFCLAVVYASLPFMIRLYYFGPGTFRLEPFPIFYSILCTYGAFYYSWFILRILALSIYDFRRKRLLLAQCSSFISPNEEMKCLFMTSLPKLVLENPDTMDSWYILRSVFLDFGRRFTLRIYLYISIMLPVQFTIAFLIIL